MTTARVSTRSSTRPVRGAGGQVRAAFLVTLATGLVALVATALLGSSAEVAGVAVGVGMVLVFFGFGGVVVNAVATVSPAASLLVALLTYTLQVVLVALVLAALRSSGALDGAVSGTAAGIAVIGATALWLGVQIRSAMRARVPVYDLPEAPAPHAAEHPDEPAPTPSPDGQEASAR